jgi:hypothetical protein
VSRAQLGPLAKLELLVQAKLELELELLVQAAHEVHPSQICQ